MMLIKEMKMVFKEFIEIYDNWDARIRINDNTLRIIIDARGLNIYDNVGLMSAIGNKEVVAFGFYDKELCIRLNI